MFPSKGSDYRIWWKFPREWISATPSFQAFQFQEGGLIGLIHWWMTQNLTFHSKESNRCHCVALINQGSNGMQSTHIQRANNNFLFPQKSLSPTGVLLIAQSGISYVFLVLHILISQSGKITLNSVGIICSTRVVRGLIMSKEQKKKISSSKESDTQNNFLNFIFKSDSCTQKPILHRISAHICK